MHDPFCVSNIFRRGPQIFVLVTAVPLPNRNDYSLLTDSLCYLPLSAFFGGSLSLQRSLATRATPNTCRCFHGPKRTTNTLLGDVRFPPRTSFPSTVSTSTNSRQRSRGFTRAWGYPRRFMLQQSTVQKIGEISDKRPNHHKNIV